MLLSLCPSFPLPHCVLKSILYVYIFIPALQLGTSVPLFFFFKQKTAYEIVVSDWSSDVCSSDLEEIGRVGGRCKRDGIWGYMYAYG